MRARGERAVLELMARYGHAVVKPTRHRTTPLQIDHHTKRAINRPRENHAVAEIQGKTDIY